KVFTTGKVFTTLRVNSLSFSGRTVPLFASMLVTHGEGSVTLTEPHHTPSPQEQHSPHHDPSSPSHPTAATEPIPQTSIEPPIETSTLRRYTRRATRIAQSKALSPAADESASLLRDNRQGEAFPTVFGLDAGQERENIIKTSALPHKSSPRVTSFDADQGSMQHKLQELMDLCTSLQMQQTRMAAKIKDQDLEIYGLKARVKSLEDNDRGGAEPTQEDAPIKRGIIETWEEVKADKSTKLRSNDTDEMRESKQLARDSEIARLHAEEELKMMIGGLDSSNEVIAKHLQEYEQAEADLTIEEKIELINELVKYQDHHAKILKYQAQQSKPLSKKEQREFYMSVLRSHAGWKTKHFRGMTLEEIKEKFIPVWKQLEYFVPMSSKEEGERLKRKGLKLDQGSAKRMKTFEDVSEEDLKGMMQLVTLEELYVEALQRRFTSAVDLGEGNFKYSTGYKRQTKGVIELKLYDTCGVHHVFTNDQEMFMLVEKDYPLRKGLATVMICNKLQVEQYSQMANDLILKIHNIANSPR
nr:hypothetical protein [Tanacetum cinerariifolium]